jgi:predicted dehydrogenase
MSEYDNKIWKAVSQSGRHRRSDKLSWAILGCGDVTEVKSGPAYQQTEGFELVAVMRRDAEKAADYARRHGVPRWYGDADALINDPEVDAVYIATPPDSHREYALRVAAAGKLCCVEKPLAPSYADSRAIHEAFAQRDLPLFVAYYRRSLPRFERIREWLEAGAIGTVRHINWQLMQPPKEIDRSGQYNWRTDPVVAPGGYFDDLASHGLDLFTHYLGPIESINGVSLNQQQLYGAKDSLAASWLHEGGITGTGSWNFGSYGRLDRVEIFGSAGRIEFAVFADQPIVLENADGRHCETIAHPTTVQLPHVRNMHRHLIEDNYTHPSTAATGLHTSWVMDRILGNTGR